MRSSSAFTRLALSAALILAVSCAKQKPQAPPEPSVTLEGEVRLLGETPAGETLTLADAGGSICTLTSPRFEYELRSLEGQTVRVTGRPLGNTPNGPEFLVESYEMAAIDGRAPVIGTLAARGGGLVLTEGRTGSVYRLGGALAEALRGYAGYRVWISGPKVSVDGAEGGSVVIQVESYGVLGPAAGSRPPAP
jgi:hypothetical protein